MHARVGVCVGVVLLSVSLSACKRSSPGGDAASEPQAGALGHATPRRLPPPSGAVPVMRNPEVIREIHHDVSPALRSMPPIRREAEEDEHEVDVVKPLPLPQPAPGNGPLAPSALAPGFGTHTPLQVRNFDGIGDGLNGFTVLAAPPDTNGDVGPSDYVQIVNTSLAIFDKANGNVTLSPVAIKTLWAGFGGLCQNDNDGDPVANYDPIADRWVISQFAVTGGPTFYECVAVSTSSDPAGSYYRYAFPHSGFPDYPKVAVWPDAYYVTFNMFNAAGTAFQGGRTCALDRTQMLAGGTATQQCFDVGTSYGGLLDADLDGPTPPPSGEPNPIVSLGLFTNQLAYWKFHVDFTTPANSTLTGPTAITVPTFAILACGPMSTSLTCVPQSGTGQKLDTLADRLMYRLAYRNFGDHESLVVDHTVDGGGGETALRWYELRLDASHDASLYQSGTFAPDTTNWRWMGSTAIDKYGNIALGYNESSGTSHPGILYTGRVPDDPLGTMSQGETTLIAGAGSQNGGLDRWGDYSSLMVDPSDDCTFWYTTEYIPANGSFNWRTRIGSFRLPGCGSDFSINVTPASNSVGRGGAAVYDVTTAVVSDPAENVHFSATGLPSGVTATFNPTFALAGNGSTLTLDVGGATTFGTYTIMVVGSAASGSHSASISLKVDQPPVANAESFTVARNGTLTVGAPGVLSNDTDPESDPLTAAVGTTTVNGTLALGADGSLTYTPNAGFRGTDSFTYLANDGTLPSPAVSDSILVDTAPGATADAYQTGRNTPLSVPAPGVLANDADPDGDALTAQLATDVTHGTLSLSTNGGFDYTPNAGYGGTDSFTYHSFDGDLGSSDVTVTIQIDEPPVANDDSYTVPMNGSLTVPAPGVLGNDTDAEADPLTATPVTTPAHGTLSLGTDGSFTYTPNAGYVGADSFTYDAFDGTFASADATVSIDVQTVDTAPVANDDSYSVNEDGSLTVPAGIGVLANDTDAESDPITAVLLTTPAHGTLTLGSNGDFTYTPTPLYFGPDGFTYDAFDGVLDSAPATVSLDVVHVNHAPTGADDTYTLNEDAPLTVPVGTGVLANDQDLDTGDTLTAVLDVNVTHGTLSFAADGSFTYTPSANYNGGDSFQYHVNDGTVDSSPVTVTLAVSAVPDAPIAQQDVYETEVDTTLHVSRVRGLLGNDYDVDGNAITTVMDGNPDSGTVVLSSDGSFVYTPPPNVKGIATFQYHATDGSLDSVSVPVTIQIGGVHRPPTVPEPVSPVVGDRAPTGASFVWLASTDAYAQPAATYHLRVLKDDTAIRDLTTANLDLALTGQDILPDGHYAWTIEALDAFGTPSGPSAPIAFQVGGGASGGCKCSLTRDTHASPARGQLLAALLGMLGLSLGFGRRRAAYSRKR